MRLLSFSCLRTALPATLLLLFLQTLLSATTGNLKTSYPKLQSKKDIYAAYEQVYSGADLSYNSRRELERSGITPQAAVDNGGFESGNFNGWRVENNCGSGSWFVYSGSNTPISLSSVSTPPQGVFAAVTDQTGAGTHILFQDVSLEPSQQHTLSFFIYYNNRAGAFFTPATLNCSGSPNQQYRVDIMNPAAPFDSVAAGDILANVFLTKPGDPTSLSPTLITFDLSQFAGSTVRLRFAEVDNQFFFNTAVDDVRITTGGAADDFRLSITPPSQTITAGSSTNFTVNAQGLNGFSQPISLSASLIPSSSNITVRLSSNTLTPGGSATLTVNTTADASAGAFNISVTGRFGQIARTVTAAAVVNAPGDSGTAQGIKLSASNKTPTGIEGRDRVFTTGSLAATFDSIGRFNDIVIIEQNIGVILILYNVDLSSTPRVFILDVNDLFTSDIIIPTSATPLRDPQTGLINLALTAVNSSGTGQVILGLNNGTGLFIDPSAFRQFSLPSGATSLLQGDFDGSGSDDDLFYLSNTNQAVVLLNDGSNDFLPPIQSETGISGAVPISAKVSDVNDDDRLDVVILSQGPPQSNQSSIAVLFGDGVGRFFPSPNLTKVPDMALSLVGGRVDFTGTGLPSIVDFNGDSLPDFAVASTRGGTASPNNSSVTLLLNRPNRPDSFSVQEPIDLVDPVSGTKLALDKTSPDPLNAGGPALVSGFSGGIGVGGATNIMSVGDFNFDGSPDLVVTGSRVVNGVNFRSSIYLIGDSNAGVMRLSLPQRTVEYTRSGSLSSSIDGGDTFIACAVGNFSPLPNELPDIVHISLRGSIWLDTNITAVLNRAPIINLRKADLPRSVIGVGRKVVINAGESLSINVRNRSIDVDGDTLRFRLVQTSTRLFPPSFVRVDETTGVLTINAASVISQDPNPLFFTIIVEATDEVSSVPSGRPPLSGRTAFTLVVLPSVITDISPLSGPVGTLVTIQGMRLSAQVVQFNGIPVDSLISSTDTQITVQVPPGALTGLINVGNTALSSGTPTMGNLVSTSALLSSFTVTTPAVVEFSPRSGPVGAPVRIIGGSFTGATSVTFNGVSARFVVDSDTQITATVPAGARSGPIIVTTPNGSSTSPRSFTNNFTIVPNQSAPTITDFSPRFGIEGKTITVTGTNLTNVRTVQLNGANADFTPVSSTSLTFIVPAGASSGPISITTATDSAMSSGIFTVVQKVATVLADIQEVVVTGQATAGSITFNVFGSGFAMDSRAFLIRFGIRQQVPIESFSIDAQGRQVITIQRPAEATDANLQIDNDLGDSDSRYRVSINRARRTISPE